VFGLSKQGYYGRIKRENRRSERNETILAMVREVRKTHPRAGTRKLSKKENKGKWGECTATNEHIGEIAAVSPQKRQCEFGSYCPARTFVKPLPRQYATTLGASGGRHSGGEKLKANSGNDYREMVIRKIAVPNPFAKVKNLCLTWWQDTREAVRAGTIKVRLGADVKSNRYVFIW